MATHENATRVIDAARATLGDRDFRAFWHVIVIDLRAALTPFDEAALLCVARELICLSASSPVLLHGVLTFVPCWAKNALLAEFRSCDEAACL